MRPRSVIAPYALLGTPGTVRVARATQAKEHYWPIDLLSVLIKTHVMNSPYIFYLLNFIL